MFKDKNVDQENIRTDPEDSNPDPLHDPVQAGSESLLHTPVVHKKLCIYIYAYFECKSFQSALLSAGSISESQTAKTLDLT